MSDIGFYGLAAVVIFLGVAVLTAISAIVFLVLVFGFHKAPLAGFFYSSLAGCALSLVLMFTVDNSSNNSFKGFMDNASLVMGPLIVLIILVIGFRYRKSVMK